MNFILIATLAFSQIIHFSFLESSQRFFDNSPSVVYPVVKSVFFNLDRLLTTRSSIPFYFKNCQLYNKHSRLVAFSKEGVGLCLYKNILREQLNLSRDGKYEINTNMVIKRSQKEVPVIIRSRIANVLGHLGNWSDYVFDNDFDIQFATPVLLSDLYSLEALSSVSRSESIDLSILAINRITITTVISSGNEDLPLIKTFNINIYTPQREAPLISSTIDLDYTVGADNDYYLNFKTKSGL